LAVSTGKGKLARIRHSSCTLFAPATQLVVEWSEIGCGDTVRGMRTAQGLLIQSVLLSAPGDCVGFPSRGLVVRGPTWFVSFPSPWGRRLPLVWVLHFRLLQDIQMSEERRGVLRRRCARWGRFQSAGCLAVGRVQVCGRVSDAAGTTGFPLAGRCTEPGLRVLHTRLFHLPSFGRGVLINGLGEVEESWRTADAGPGWGVRTVDTVLPGRAARVLLRGRLVVVRVLGPPLGLAGSGLLVQQRVEPRGRRWLLGGSHSVGVSSIRPSAVTVRLGVRVFGRRRCRVFRHITALWFLLTGMAASLPRREHDAGTTTVSERNHQREQVLHHGATLGTPPPAHPTNAGEAHQSYTRDAAQSQQGK
jgi:hypothetical protein